MPLLPARARQGRASLALHAPQGRKPPSAGWSGQAPKGGQHGPDEGGLQSVGDRPRASLAAAAGHDLAKSKTAQEGQSISCLLSSSDLASGEPEIPRSKHEPLLRRQRGAG
jgi:hypothetical protein